MEKIIYKKVTIAIENNDDSVTIQCIRLKGDEKLEIGEQVTVRGELKRRDSRLEFGNGCEFVKVADAPDTDVAVLSALRDLPEGEFYADGFCALTGRVTVIEKIPNNAPQRITYLIGALAMFFAGVFYMFMSDLAFNSNSFDLIVAVLLSFGGAILFFLSATFSEKPTVMWVFKGVGIALSVLFVVYVHTYQAGFSFGKLADPEKILNYPEMLEVFRKRGVSGEADLIKSQMTIIVALVFSYIAIVAQAANTALEAVFKEE